MISYLILVIGILSQHIAMLTYYKRYKYFENFYSDLGYNHPDNHVSRKIVFISSCVMFILSMFIDFSYLQLSFISFSLAGIFHYNRGHNVESIIHGIGFVCGVSFIMFALAFSNNWLHLVILLNYIISFLSELILFRYILKYPKDIFRLVECPIQKVLFLYIYYLMFILI